MKKPKTRFVIVHVSYDWYRFQDNLGVADSMQEALWIAVTESSKRRNIEIISNAAQSEAMDNSETPHIYIEKFEQP